MPAGGIEKKAHRLPLDFDLFGIHVLSPRLLFSKSFPRVFRCTTKSGGKMSVESNSEKTAEKTGGASDRQGREKSPSRKKRETSPGILCVCLQGAAFAPGSVDPYSGNIPAKNPACSSPRAPLSAEGERGLDGMRPSSSLAFIFLPYGTPSSSRIRASHFRTCSSSPKTLAQREPS